MHIDELNHYGVTLLPAYAHAFRIEGECLGDRVPFVPRWPVLKYRQRIYHKVKAACRVDVHLNRSRVNNTVNIIQNHRYGSVKVGKNGTMVWGVINEYRRASICGYCPSNGVSLKRVTIHILTFEKLDMNGLAFRKLRMWSVCEANKLGNKINHIHEERMRYSAEIRWNTPTVIGIIHIRNSYSIRSPYNGGIKEPVALGKVNQVNIIDVFSLSARYGLVYIKIFVPIGHYPCE